MQIPFCNFEIFTTFMTIFTRSCPTVTLFPAHCCCANSKAFSAMFGADGAQLSGHSDLPRCFALFRPSPFRLRRPAICGCDLAGGKCAAGNLATGKTPSRFVVGIFAFWNFCDLSMLWPDQTDQDRDRRIARWRRRSDDLKLDEI